MGTTVDPRLDKLRALIDAERQGLPDDFEPQGADPRLAKLKELIAADSAAPPAAEPAETTSPKPSLGSRIAGAMRRALAGVADLPTDRLSGALAPSGVTPDVELPEGEHSFVREAAAGTGRGIGQIIEGSGGLTSAVGTAARTQPLSEDPARRKLGLVDEPARPNVISEALEDVGGRVADVGQSVREAEILRPSRSVEEGGAFDWSNPRWWVARGFEQLPQLLGQFGLAAATGGSTLGQVAAFAAPVAVLEAGSAYNDNLERLRQQGMPEQEARARALDSAVLTGAGAAVLEGISGSVLLLNEIPGAGKVFRRALEQHRLARGAAGATAEGITEAAQEAWADVIAYASTADPQTFNDWAMRYAGAGAIGALLGGGAGVVTPGQGAAEDAATDARQVEAPITAASEPDATPVVSSEELGADAAAALEQEQASAPQLTDAPPPPPDLLPDTFQSLSDLPREELERRVREGDQVAIAETKRRQRRAQRGEDAPLVSTEEAFVGHGLAESEEEVSEAEAPPPPDQDADANAAEVRNEAIERLQSTPQGRRLLELVRAQADQDRAAGRELLSTLKEGDVLIVGNTRFTKRGDVLEGDDGDVAELDSNYAAELAGANEGVRVERFTDPAQGDLFRPRLREDFAQERGDDEVDHDAVEADIAERLSSARINRLTIERHEREPRRMKLTPRQRKSMEEDIAEAEEIVDGMLQDYENRYGEQAAIELRDRAEKRVRARVEHLFGPQSEEPAPQQPQPQRARFRAAAIHIARRDGEEAFARGEPNEVPPQYESKREQDAWKAGWETARRRAQDKASAPLPGRGQRIRRVRIEKGKIIPGQGATKPTVTYEEEYEDGSFVTRAEDGSVIQDYNPNERTAPQPEESQTPAELDFQSETNDLLSRLPSQAQALISQYVATNDPRVAETIAAEINAVPGLREALTDAIARQFGWRITVYRAGGVGTGAQSWTTSLDRARHFATFDSEGRPAGAGARPIVQGEINAADVLFPAAIEDGEIVVRGGAVQNVHRVGTEVPAGTETAGEADTQPEFSSPAGTEGAAAEPQPPTAVDRIEQATERIASALEQVAGRLEEATTPAAPETPSGPVVQQMLEEEGGTASEEEVHRLVDAAYEAISSSSLPTKSAELRKWAGDIIGRPYSSGTWKMDDVYDAIEGAVNLWVRWMMGPQSEVSSRLIRDRLATAKDVEERIFQGRLRSAGMLARQQFSTPLPIAEAAAYAASVIHGEKVLEPTAGTGNLVNPLFGAVSVDVNELEPRRVAVLRKLGFNPTTEDALRLQLSGKRYNAVVTNPPYGHVSRGRYHGFGATEFAASDVSQRFVAAAMQSLVEGGRLVAVMPPNTLADSATAFNTWLRENHTPIAYIESPEGAYEGRGTGIGTVLLVVDKGKPEGAPKQPYTLRNPTWEQWFAAIQDFGPGGPLYRQYAHTTAVDVEPVAVPTSKQAAGPKREAQLVDRSIVEPKEAPDDGTETESEPGPGRDLDARTREGTADVGGTERGVPAGERSPESGRGAGDRGGRDAGVVADEPSGPATEVVEGAAPEVGARRARRRVEPRSGDSEARRREIEEANNSAVFAPYPLDDERRRVSHPRLVVETRSMAGLPAPPITASFQSSEVQAAWGRSGAEGGISDEQADAALRTLSAWDRGHGMLIADDVGVGKTREAATVILEALARGHRRIIYTTKNENNVRDAMAELRRVASGSDDGTFPAAFVFVGDYKDVKKGEASLPMPDRPVIYFAHSYNFTDYAAALKEVQATVWIADEAHEFKNQFSGRGIAWRDLHVDMLGRGGRFMYLTATPAVTLDELGYLYGLQEWAPGGFADWVSRKMGRNTGDPEAAKAGSAAVAAQQAENVALGEGAGELAEDERDAQRGKKKFMRNRPDIFSMRVTPAETEQVMRELKGGGKYLARDLWRGGVTFEVETLDLLGNTPEARAARARYNEAAAIAREISMASRKFGYMNAKVKTRGLERSLLQSYMKQLLFDLRLDRVLQLADEAIAAGKQVVISVHSVAGDADLEEGVSAADAEVPLNKRLESAINRINFQHIVKEGKGEEAEFVDLGEIPEALLIRAELLRRVRELPPLRDPIRTIEDHFGAKNVAPITGKKSAKERSKLMGEFQAGKRNIALISKAGKVGISLHDVNGKQRRMIVADYEWSADTFKQELGRVDRTGQQSPPEIILVASNLAGEKKFAATIAARMASLGATSKGAADATGTDALDQFDVSNSVALDAMKNAYEKMTPEMKSYFTGSEFVEAQRVGPEMVEFRPKKRPDNASMRHFLLEMMMLPVEQSDKAWDIWVQERDALMTGEQAEAQAARRTAKARGQVLRVTNLVEGSRPLTLYEVRNAAGEKAAIVQGFVTDHIADIQNARGKDQYGNLKSRRYVQFTTEDGELISGLELNSAEAGRVRKLFGKGGRTRVTKQDVWDDLQTGEKPVVMGAGNVEWELHLRKDGRIQIRGATLAKNRTDLASLARYETVGNYLYIPGTQEALNRFLDRFPPKQPSITEQGGSEDDDDDFTEGRPTVDLGPIGGLTIGEVSETELRRQLRGSLVQRVRAAAKERTRRRRAVGRRDPEYHGARGIMSGPTRGSLVRRLAAVTREPQAELSALTDVDLVERAVRANVLDDAIVRTIHEDAQRSVQDNAPNSVETYHTMGLPALEEALLGKRRGVVPSDRVVPTSASDEVEARWQAAKGIKLPSARRRAMEGLRALIASFRRADPHLDPHASEKHALWADELRVYKSSPQWAQSIAFDKVAEITDGLTPEQVDLMTRVLVLHDIEKDIEAGLYDDKALPFGYEDATALSDDLNRFLDLAEADTKIVAAMGKRRRFAGALTKRLVELELLNEKVLEDPRYYHRQVLEYVNAQDRAWLGTTSRDIRMKTKGFQRARTGGGDFNTAYQEAEFEWMAHAFSLIARKEFLDRTKRLWDVKRALKRQAKDQNKYALGVKILGGPEAAAAAYEEEGIDPLDVAHEAFKPYRKKIGMARSALEGLARAGELRSVSGVFDDIIEQLAIGRVEGQRWFDFLRHLLQNELPGAREAGMIFKAINEQEMFIRNTLGKAYVTWEDLVPEGHVKWQPEKGNHFFLATTIAEDVLDRVLAGEITDPDARKMLVVGGRKEEWVIPTEVAATLDNFKPIRDDGPIEGLWVAAQNTWKQWVLLNPKRLLSYSLNNFIGDLDISFAYDPAILKGLFRAGRDLHNYMRGHGSNALKREMQDAIKRGVIGSGLTVAEIPDINKTGAFKALTSQNEGDLRKMVDAYWRATKGFSTWRENVLRLAAYRYFQQQVKTDKPVYGVSDRNQIDAIKDPQQRAARLARDLLGDYGNISEAGQWIRRHMIPFYSWMEINAPRYYRLLKNLPHEGVGGGKLARAGRRGAVLSVKGAAAVGLLALKINIIFLVASAFNRLVFPDEEEQLRREGRRAHLILGRNKDGTIRYIRLEGAFADALKWFALEDYPSDIRDLVDGEADWLDLLSEAVKAPVDRIVTGLEPVTKTLYETISGRSSYPTIFGRGKDFHLRSRPIRDRVENLTRVVSLDWLYRRVTGRPRRQGGDQARNIIGSLLLYQTDPGEAAYWEIREKIFQWQRKQGKPAPDIRPTERSNALYYWRQALKWGDEEAAQKWLRKYVELGGDDQGLEASIRLGMPTGGMSKAERQAFVASLSQRDRETLAQAMDWYRRTYLGGARDTGNSTMRHQQGRALGIVEVDTAQWRRDAAKKAADVINSPFVRDTLFQISGRAKTVKTPPYDQIVQEPGGSTSAIYATATKRGELILRPVFFNLLTQKQREETLSHEAGHLLDFATDASPQSVYDAIKNTKEFRVRKARDRVRQRYEELRSKNPELYAASSPDEHFAQSFAVGMAVMRSTWSQPRSDAERVIRVVDKALPGAQEMVELLRYEPVFEGHPLFRTRRSVEQFIKDVSR